MRIATLFHLPILLLLSAAAAASPRSEAALRLDGEWRGPDYVLKVDSRRAQASVNPERPFEWQRFEVKEAEGDEVVFSIGAELFEARMDGEMLLLTGTAFRGERVLFRGEGLRGTTDE
jgi:hypothetical protein